MLIKPSCHSADFFCFVQALVR